MTAEEIIRELPKGLIKWYDFRRGQRAVYITAETQLDSALAEAIRESGIPVDCVRPDELEQYAGAGYDLAVVTSAAEHTRNAEEAVSLLTGIKRVLNGDGRLFLGMNNRLGIRYFCGDRDKYTNRNFDGVENYVRADISVFDRMTCRCYARAEIEDMLTRAGFPVFKFYAVFPLLERPQILFADGYMPNEQLDIRISPQYDHADTVFLEEERLYDTLLKNNLFHTMANAFWVECALNGGLSTADQVTMSMDRGRENAMFTILYQDDKVVKKPVYREGKEKIQKLLENRMDLMRHQIHMVQEERQGDSCVMPYVRAQSTLEYFRGLLLEDREAFLEELEKYWQMILHSSEHTPYGEIDWERYEPGWQNRIFDETERYRWKKLAFGTVEEQESIGVILKRGYIDLIPLNSFYVNGRYVFYDQELYIDNLPAKVIMMRTIDVIYQSNSNLEHILPAEEVKERYGLLRCKQLFYRFTNTFLNDLRNDRLLKQYHQAVRRNKGMIHANRQRMNFSAEEYDRIFRDIFRGADGRKLYLFGSGQFAERFLSQFGQTYEIAGILDNNPCKWGSGLEGIPIVQPEILKEQAPGTYKVIICIKNYTAVMHQLEEMGIADFGVYDCNMTYARRKTVDVSGGHVQQEKKKYHVGYLAGVFDLFHVGHLNLFKRAKEQCDYLIVGVVTDAGVIRNKHTKPFVPFEERIELVRSCKYVDEAVEIPLEYFNTDEAYRRYQFDVQFSGSDYAQDPAWEEKREYLRKRGSDLVFFPYTQSTSSTRLKALIEQQLIGERT